LQDVLNHPDFEWDYSWLSRNPHITMQDVLNHPEMKWDYMRLSENPNITLHEVLNNPGPWCYLDLRRNPSIKLDLSIEDENLINQDTRLWLLCSILEGEYGHNPNLSWEEFEKDPNKYGSYSCFSANPHLTWDIVKSNINEDWN